MYWPAALMPISARPLNTTPITSPPSSAWIGLPRPPNRLAPPITAAATAYSVYLPPSTPVEIEPRKEMYTSPAIPAVTAVSMKTILRTRCTLMPARRAASGLAPIAYMYRPSRVRPSRIEYANRTSPTKGTTQGTPLSGTSRPRLRLQMYTTTIPPTAVTAIVSRVMLRGGALSPCARRRASRDSDTAANIASPTASAIHDAAGLMLLFTSL